MNRDVRIYASQYTVGEDVLGFTVERCKSLLIYSMPRADMQPMCSLRNANVYWRPCDYVVKRSADRKAGSFCKTNCTIASRLAQANLRPRKRERDRIREKSCARTLCRVSPDCPRETRTDYEKGSSRKTY